MGAKFLLSNAVPASPGSARTLVKDSGSGTLFDAAATILIDRLARIPDRSALFLYGDSSELHESLIQAGKDGVFGVCSDSGQPLDKHFVRFDFGLSHATLIVVAAPGFWGGQPAAPWTDAGGAMADTFFTRMMKIDDMPAMLNVMLPDIVDYAKAHHDQALASVW